MRNQSTKKTQRLFRPWEQTEVTRNKDSLHKALSSPHIEDKAAVRDAIKRMDGMEREHGVPDLTADERDKANKRLRELEGQIKEGMLSAEEMRRNPPGAVDQNMWWEKRNKKKIALWRNLTAALHKGISGDQARDLFNLERLRPRTNHLNMDNAQIPAARAFSFPSERYQENYDSIFKPKAPEESSVLDEPEEPTAQEQLLEESAFLESRPEAQRALGVLAKGRGAKAAG